MLINMIDSSVFLTSYLADVFQKQSIGVSPTRVFLCEIFEIFWNTIFNKTPPVTASGILKFFLRNYQKSKIA